MTTVVPQETGARTTLLAAELMHALQQENDQLRTALASRISIEQAKGVLAERYGLTPD